MGDFFNFGKPPEDKDVICSAAEQIISLREHNTAWRGERRKNDERRGGKSARSPLQAITPIDEADTIPEPPSFTPRPRQITRPVDRPDESPGPVSVSRPETYYNEEDGSAKDLPSRPGTPTPYTGSTTRTSIQGASEAAETPVSDEIIEETIEVGHSAAGETSPRSPGAKRSSGIQMPEEFDWDEEFETHESDLCSQTPQQSREQGADDPEHGSGVPHITVRDADTEGADNEVAHGQTLSDKPSQQSEAGQQSEGALETRAPTDEARAHSQGTDDEREEEGGGREEGSPLARQSSKWSPNSSEAHDSPRQRSDDFSSDSSEGDAAENEPENEALRFKAEMEDAIDQRSDLKTSLVDAVEMATVTKEKGDTITTNQSLADLRDAIITASQLLPVAVADLLFELLGQVGHKMRTIRSLSEDLGNAYEERSRAYDDATTEAMEYYKESEDVRKDAEKYYHISRQIRNEAEMRTSSLLTKEGVNRLQLLETEAYKLRRENTNLAAKNKVLEERRVEYKEEQEKKENQLQVEIDELEQRIAEHEREKKHLWKTLEIEMKERKACQEYDAKLAALMAQRREKMRPGLVKEHLIQAFNQLDHMRNLIRPAAVA